MLTNPPSPSESYESSERERWGLFKIQIRTSYGRSQIGIKKIEAKVEKVEKGRGEEVKEAPKAEIRRKSEGAGNGRGSGEGWGPSRPLLRDKLFP